MTATPVPGATVTATQPHKPPAPATQAAPRSSPTGGRPASTPQVAFQRLNVTQSASTSAITNEGAFKAEEIADLNQSAANSFIVHGSMSSAVGLPQQNDWGRRGVGPEQWR